MVGVDEVSTMANASSDSASAPAKGVWRGPLPGEQRSPCPALNSLANGGYLPRDGQGLTAAQLVESLRVHLGILPNVGGVLAKMALEKLGKEGPGGTRVLDLAALAKHGVIEHDASLTRRDAHRGDQAELVKSLVDQLVSLSRDGKTLTKEDLAVAHQLRMAQSASGGHAVPFKAGVIGTLEAALLFVVLSRNGVIAVEDAVEFLEHERLPASFSPREVGWGEVLKTAVEMGVMGNVPLFEAAKRAREVVGRVADPEGSR